MLLHCTVFVKPLKLQCISLERYCGEGTAFSLKIKIYLNRV
jgi:hypothetical protein